LNASDHPDRYRNDRPFSSRNIIACLLLSALATHIGKVAIVVHFSRCAAVRSTRGSSKLKNLPQVDLRAQHCGLDTPTLKARRG
jgi:hypothetical protein